jgi:hypothetical protein
MAVVPPKDALAFSMLVTNHNSPRVAFKDPSDACSGPTRRCKHFSAWKGVGKSSATVVLVAETIRLNLISFLVQPRPTARFCEAPLTI